ncbi:Biotin operon repressor / Biotin--protein ligase [hydrothermal vent metagenome]|uniref:Biotin operon repressor / Biotin--protein ligase n=1 Tax=hydrothermal vent metagenome TaxID=652676 RepID=A0A3B1AIE9_9ZZZZ
MNIMTDLLALLTHLSDGQFHSGEDLAAELDISRTAIWKQIKKLNIILPVKIISVHGKGYKIEHPMTVLNKNKIMGFLSAELQTQLNQIEVLLECGSTNQYLLERVEQNQLKNYVVLAEMQTQGRGRRGRHWVSPFASNIYMSLLWHMDISIAEMAGLSLVVAISVARALQKLGVNDVMLKWPNDVYVDGQKLAGVLLELRGESNSPCNAVIGIGVNVNMPSNVADNIDQPWVDIQQLLKKQVNRNEVVAMILNELIPRLQQFNDSGFCGFMAEWTSLDLLAGKAINIEGHMQLNEGVASGVDKQGALLVEYKGTVQPLYSGEVSIRPKKIN